MGHSPVPDSLLFIYLKKFSILHFSLSWNSNKIKIKNKFMRRTPYYMQGLLSD